MKKEPDRADFECFQDFGSSEGRRNPVVSHERIEARRKVMDFMLA